MEAPAPERGSEHKRVVLMAAAFIGGAIVVWGVSMFVLRVNLQGTVELFLQERERRKGLEAWVKRAGEVGLDYDKAIFDPEGSLNKPVVWEVEFPPGDAPGRYRGDHEKPIRWVRDPGLPTLGTGKTARNHTVVAIIREVSPPESVRQATGKQYPGAPYYIKLEFLGTW